ncbi:MAG: hypothetical protein V5804_07945 [Mucilaginibacter sp.]|uniref:hypothetical protein n=1 Tax=Mucilaginibacter sp. TaxID=1882438 RepID=UPI0034E5769D
MKILGLLVGFLGILILACTVILTPAHSFNPADSTNGTSANAAIFFGGLIVFGAGVVLYANAIEKKAHEKKVN